MDYHTKQKVDQFWKDWWKLSPEHWIFILEGKARNAKDMLYRLPTILHLEGKIDEEQKISLTKMLRSKDLGDAQMALSIIKTISPKIFKYKKR